MNAFAVNCCSMFGALKPRPTAAPSENRSGIDVGANICALRHGRPSQSVVPLDTSAAEEGDRGASRALTSESRLAWIAMLGCESTCRSLPNGVAGSLSLERAAEGHRRPAAVFAVKPSRRVVCERSLRSRSVLVYASPLKYGMVSCSGTTSRLVGMRDTL